MKSPIVEKILKRTPLETRLKVDIEVAFITLLSDLGYRDGYWKPEEDEKLAKLCKKADELAKDHIETIKKWEEDGKPM